MRRAVAVGLLVMLAGCGWKTADEANGTNSGDNSSSVFTNSTTVTTITGSVTTTVRPAGSFVSSQSANGAAPFTTTTSSGTFITDRQLVVPAETVVTLETVTDRTSTPAARQEQLRASGRTVTVTSIVAWTPGLNPGQSITLTSGQSINVPSGTTITTLDGGSVTVNGHHNPVSTSTGAVVEAPSTASGAADNTVTAL